MSFTARLIAKTAPWSNADWQAYMRAAATAYEQVDALTEEHGDQGRPGWVPPYQSALNPATAPGYLLRWLAQFPGVVVPVGSSEAEARALIKAESGLERGTTASVEAAIQAAIAPFWMPLTPYLKGQLVRHETTPGALTCYEAQANFTSGSSFTTEHLAAVNIRTQYELLAREKANGETNAYYFTVLCHGYQLTPAGNLTQMRAKVNAAKPAGLVPEYVITEEPLQTDPYIDEFSRLIENIEGEIETLTLADVT
jgi:hypothetical protein